MPALSVNRTVETAGKNKYEQENHLNQDCRRDMITENYQQANTFPP